MISSKPSLSKQIEELSVAHSCTILIYSRHKFSSKLAKAIRPEVARLFITSEAKDCIDIIRKQNKYSDSVGIDMVILDSDPSALKVLEYIHNRSISSKFATYPMISKMVLYTHHEDNEFKRNAEFIGGFDTKYIEMPTTPKEVFKSITSILFRHQMIDKSYREIQQTNHSTTYPYLPIFEANRDEDEEDEDDDDDDDEVNKLLDELANIGANSQNQNAPAMSTFELDDWTDSVSILPIAVLDARASQPVTDLDDYIGKSREEQLAKEMIERNTKDHALLKLLTEGRDDLLMPNQVETNMINFRPHSLSNVDDDTLSTDTLKVEVKGKQNKKRTSMVEIAPQNRRINLLDVRRRPKWEAKRGRGNKATGSNGLADAEVTLYFDRQPPNLAMARTVGGLNRKQAEYCWNVFAAVGDLEKLKLLNHTGSSKGDDLVSHAHHAHGAKGTPLITNINSPGIDSPKLVDPYKYISASAYSSPTQRSKQNNIIRPQTTVGSQSQISFWNQSLSTSNSIASAFSQDSQVANQLTRPTTTASTSASRKQSTSSKSNLESPTASNYPGRHGSLNLKLPDGMSDGPFSPFGSQGYRRQFDNYRQAVQKAERMLRKLVKETPPDVQIHRVVDVNLSNRSVNKWEKGLIEEGKQAELDGLLDHAVSSITRAGINSKEPHLSKLFLGSFYFRTGKYLSAIDNYSDALRMVFSIKSSSMYNKEDEFVGKFNRAITYFRTGNDPEGIKDLEESLKIDPKNVVGLEVYAIVLRRLGRYDEAIKVKAEVLASSSSQKTRHVSHSRRAGTIMPPIPSPTELASTSQPSMSEIRLERPGLKKDKLHISLRSLGERSDGPKSNRSTRSGGTPMSNRDGGDTERSVNNSDRAIYIHVPEPKGGLSLKEKKIVARLKRKTDNENEEYVESLTAFKLMNGFKASLFETLFVKPDVLQEALLVSPNRRTARDIEVIGTNLKLITLFRDLSSSIISEIANRIEYRTILPKVEIFQQNLPCDAICIVLKGTVQMKMDGMVRGTQNITIGPDLIPGDVFGHTDLLFQQQDSPFMVELRRRIKENEFETHHKKIHVHEEEDDGIVIKGHLPHHHGNLHHNIHPDHNNNGINTNTNGNSTKSHNHHEGHDTVNIHNHPTLNRMNSASQKGKKIQDTNLDDHTLKLKNLKHHTLNKSFAATLINDSNPLRHLLKRQSKLHMDISEPMKSVSTNKSDQNNNSTTKSINRLASANSLNSFKTMTISDINTITHNSDGLNNKDQPHNNNNNSIHTTEASVHHQYRSLTQTRNTRSVSTTSQNIILPSAMAATSNTIGLDDPSINKYHRALAPGLFATYTTQSYSEVLLLNERDFYKLLLSLSINDFRKRYEVIKASGVFHGWSDLDMIRIARMGQIKSYKQGDVILGQKEKPLHLFFVLNGISKAFKTPNKYEVLERKLVEAKAKAERYDLKYSYHHKLRNVIEHVDVVSVLQNDSDGINTLGSINGIASNSLPNQASRLNSTTITAVGPLYKGSSGYSSIPNNASYFGSIDLLSEYQMINSPTKVITADITSKITQSEAERFKLQLEIQQLESLLHKIGNNTNNTNKNESSFNNKGIYKNSTNSQGNILGSKSSATRTMNVDDDNICELATLKWPMVFGEACVLEPEIGFSRGSIVATTSCDIFMIHKTQIQTFHINDGFLEKLHERSVIYPEDDVLVEIMMKKKAWKAYRQGVVNELPKNRWPKEKTQNDPFI